MVSDLALDDDAGAHAEADIGFSDGLDSHLEAVGAGVGHDVAAGHGVGAEGLQTALHNSQFLTTSLASSWMQFQAHIILEKFVS